MILHRQQILLIPQAEQRVEVEFQAKVVVKEIRILDAKGLLFSNMLIWHFSVGHAILMIDSTGQIITAYRDHTAPFKRRSEPYLRGPVAVPVNHLLSFYIQNLRRSEIGPNGEENAELVTIEFTGTQP